MLYQFVDACGQKRKGIKTNCQYCGIEFIRRNDKSTNGRKKFCSAVCRNKSKERKVEIICAWCNKKHLKKPKQLTNSKSGFYFCSRKCKDKAQKLGGIQEIMPPHYGTAKIPHYRRWFDGQELSCSRCGYNEFRVAVQIHHIDENRENNDKKNLIPICANCHWALHNNEWKIEDILKD